MIPVVCDVCAGTWLPGHDFWFILFFWAEIFSVSVGMYNRMKVYLRLSRGFILKAHDVAGGIAKGEVKQKGE